MKAAILCNGINLTIKKKHNLQHMENKSPYEWKAAELI